MKRQEPTAAEMRRWLTLESGQRLRLPPQFNGDTPQATAGRAAWINMHRFGDAARAASRTWGADSREARRLRSQARNAGETVLAAIGETREEVVARMSRRSQAGLDALALMRY